MKYVIIGNCAAGINALEAIRENDKKSPITIISDENYPAYCRCLISYYLAGTRKENDLLLRPEGFYDKMGAETLFGKKVIGVLPEKKKIIMQDKKELAFDRLLIATGGNPKSIGVEGEDKAGVYKFRTIDDAKGLLKLASSSKKAVVLGGGLIGLKAAYGLKHQGLEVEVVIKSSIVMSQVIDEGASDILKNHLEKNGIKIRTGLAARKILGKDKVEAVILDNGEEVKCDIVVIGKGVAANTGLIKDSKIKTHWGILTDECLQTNVKDIYAAGDCAETFDVALEQTTVNALWTAASLQGRIAGLNMAGARRIYDGSVAENSVEFFGLPIISLGIRKIPKQDSGQYQELIRISPERLMYKKVILKDGRLVGAILAGTFRNAGVYLSLIRAKINVGKIQDMLLEDGFNFARIKDLMPAKKEELSKSISIEGKFI